MIHLTIHYFFIIYQYIQKLRCQPGTTWNGTFCDCQTGWTRFGSSCYQRVDAGKTFANAEADCESKKGTLVVISSADEYNFIKTFRNLGQSVYVWNWFLTLKLIQIIMAFNFLDWRHCFCTRSIYEHRWVSSNIKVCIFNIK